LIAGQDSINIPR